MPFTVFYAWQSDRDEKVNHYLIRDAIQDAIDAVLADLRIEEAPELEADTTPATAEAEAAIELDWATKDEPGTPNVAQAIFTKIGECGVFVADLTYVAEAQSADGRQKLLPNSNVMVELGQASASVGWRQILLVMNRHFGKPEHLPFDLKNYAFPVTYELAPGADKKTRDAERKKLAKAFEHKLRIMQKRGIWTKKADEEERARRATVEARKAVAQAERDALEQKLLDNTYYDMKTAYGVMAAVIIPANPPATPLRFTDDVKLMNAIPPPGVSGCQIRHRPKSVTCGESDGGLSYNMVELTNTGSVYMARNLTYGRDGIGPNYAETIDPSKGWPVAMDTYQPQFLESVQRYLKALVDFGVKGPWYFGLSMLKMKNGLLIPSRNWYFFRELGRPLTDDNMRADTILISADVDLSDPNAVTEAIKPPLKEIYRHNGHRGMPIFDGNNITIEA